MSEGYTSSRVWTEYQTGEDFNNALGLYETVERNEDFYTGNQWRGVNAPDLDKPVINVLSRVVKFCISSIMSDDIGVGLDTFDESDEQKPVLDMLSAQFDEIMEMTAFKKKAREVIRNAAVDSDGCMHFYFDPDAESGVQTGGFEATPGGIRAEIIENTAVHFGNPQSADVQSQPYLLLVFRRLVRDVRQAAKRYGQDPEQIVPDEDDHPHGDATENGKVTVIRRYWKENGTVWFTEVTKTAVVRPATDTGYKRYPVAFFAWEKVKSQYHGQALVTAVVPNQIYINKLFAMAMQHVKMMAFPKVVYNRNLLPGGWDNRVGAAIGVPGDPNVAIASNFRAADMSNQVMEILNTMINYTRDTMGASDAALGNVNPDNTSAIVATQKATSMPLELQKQDFYAFVEDSVRIWLDMMRANYGVRLVKLKIPAEMSGMDESVQTVPFDFSQLSDMNLRLNVEIGAATYWSELMQVQTLDALFTNGILTDAEVYLENMPKGYITGKDNIIQAIRQQKAQAAAMAQQQMAAQGMQGGAAL